MARKPKTQPSTEAAVPELAIPNEAAAPARRGRKPKATASSPALLSAARTGDPATADVEADASKAVPTKTPGRRGPGRKPKQRGDVEAAALPQDTAAEQASAEADPSAAGPEQAQAEDDAPVAEMAFPLDGAGAADALPGGAHPADAVPSAAGPDTTARAAPAARWDPAMDNAEFDWPEIERMAAHDGPNQPMAKLLVAARAEGASSRWPL